jgi:hypothetical protein
MGLRIGYGLVRKTPGLPVTIATYALIHFISFTIVIGTGEFVKQDGKARDRDEQAS